MKDMTFVKIDENVESDERHLYVKDVKYIEIRTRKLDNKRMKDITFVDNVDICWNKYKYQKELKYNERVEIR